MIISAMLKKSGFPSEVVNADMKSLRTKLNENIPSILAFSTPTAFSQTYLELNRKIQKEYQVFSIFGGPHPTFFPEMIHEEGVEAICIGEGEFAMLELVEHIYEKKSPDNIQNLWVKRNGEINRNPLRPLIQDLDRLPLPDHEVFRTATPHSIWNAMVLTGRGCPYNCTYCYNHVYRNIYKNKGKIIRRRSVDNVMEELRSIKKRSCYKFIRFLDDLFTLSPEWVEEFSFKYKKDIGLPFSCLVRANHITPEIARNLKEAGCWRVQMGVESGDERVRNTILKRKMTEEEILNAAEIIKEAGIKLVTGNILGIPGGSLESDFKTLELNLKIKPHFATAGLLQPYPKTEIQRYAQELGMLNAKSASLREFTVGRATILKYKDKKDKQRVENLQRFFSLTVEFPWLLFWVKKLIELPSNRMYDFILARWMNFCHYFKVIPPRIGLRSIWKRHELYHKAHQGIRAVRRLFKKNRLN